jgi:hypothetical protein
VTDEGLDYLPSPTNMMFHNSHHHSFSYSVGGSSGGGSSSDSIFLFADDDDDEEEDNTNTMIGGGKCRESNVSDHFDSSSNNSTSSSIDADEDDTTRCNRLNDNSFGSNDTSIGSVMTMRRSNIMREKKKKIKGVDPCEENNINILRHRYYHHKPNNMYYNNYSSIGTIKKDPPSSSAGPPPTSSSGIMAAGIAKHYHNSSSNSNATMKKRLNFDMWILRQQQQQNQVRQFQQRDGNTSILTDEMSEMQLQYHLSQKRQQQQQPSSQPQQQLRQQLHNGQLHNRSREEQMEPPPQQQQQLMTSSQMISSSHQQLMSHSQQQSSSQEQEVEDHWQKPKNQHRQDPHHHQPLPQPQCYPSSNRNQTSTGLDFGIPNHPRRRRWSQQQQRSRYRMVGEDIVMEEVVEDENEDENDDDEGVQQQQQQQQPLQSHHSHQTWRQRSQQPYFSLQREPLQSIDDHRLQQQQQHQSQMQLQHARHSSSLPSGSTVDGPMHEIVNHSNSNHFPRDTRRNIDVEEEMEKGGMAEVQSAKKSLELAPASNATISLRPPTHPDGRRFPNIVPLTVCIGKSTITTSTVPTIHKPTTTSIVYDDHPVIEEDVTREDALLVVTPHASSSLASSSHSFNPAMEGAIGRINYSSMSPSTTTTTSAGRKVTPMAQEVGKSRGDVDHDETYTKRHSQHHNLSMASLSEQSPTRSDHSADNAAGVGNGFGRINVIASVGVGAPSTHNSSPTEHNITAVRSRRRRIHDLEADMPEVDAAASMRRDRDENSTTLPMTSSLLIKQRVISQTGAPATLPSPSIGDPSTSSSINASFSNDQGTTDYVIGNIPRRVSFDESEIESSMLPPEKELNLEEKLSSLLQRQRLSQQHHKKSADNFDDDDMMMIGRSHTFDSSFTNKSMKSSALASTAASSAQLSVESECVRQNAQIAEMMEGAMMDFFVLSHATESNENTTLNVAAPINHDENMQVRSPGHFSSGDDGRDNLDDVKVHDPKDRLVIPSASPKAVNVETDREPASPPKMNHLAALSSANSDNKDLARFLFRFSDQILNGCNNYDTDSSDVFFIDNSQFGKEEDASRCEVNQSDDTLNNKTPDVAAPPHLLTRSAAFGRVGSTISEDSEEDDVINSLHHFEKSRSLPNLPPASTFLSAKERARIRQHDTTPVRTNTSHARYRKYVHMHSDGDISMASIKEELVEEDEMEESGESGDGVVEDAGAETAKTNDEGVISEEERAYIHSRENAPNIYGASEAFDHRNTQSSVQDELDMLDRPAALHDNSCFASDVVNVDTAKVLPTQFDSCKVIADLTPEVQPDQKSFECPENRPVDPPSDVSFGIDHSGDFDVNNQSFSSDASSDNIEMTYREQQKGRSLAWHSTNGVNDDELYDTNQLPRSKGNSGTSIAGRLKSIAKAEHASMIRQQAADENENACVERKHQLGLIEETSLEGSESSTDECSTSQDEDDVSSCSSSVGKGTDGGLETSAQTIESSSSSESSSSASSASSSGTPVPPPRSSQNRIEYRPPATKIRTNTLYKSDIRDVKKKTAASDLPPIIRLDMKHGPMLSAVDRRRNPAKQQTNLDGYGSARRQPVNRSQFSRASSSRQHPHHVPHELSKSRLEEKLRGNSTRDSLVVGNCGNNSVGTSELGSLFTRDSDRSQLNVPVPSVIFHRTYPRMDIAFSKTNTAAGINDVGGASTKNASSSEGSKSPSDCTPDSGRQVMNSQRIVHQHRTPPLHTTEKIDEASERAYPSRQPIDIGDIIENFIAKINEEIFESATTDVASSTQPDALVVGEDPDLGQPSAANPIGLDRTILKPSAGTEMIISTHRDGRDTQQLEPQSESTIVDANNMDEIGIRKNVANLAIAAKERRQTEINLSQHNPIAFMGRSNTRSDPSSLRNANRNNSDTEHGESFWPKLDELQVRRFWSQLELDDEQSTAKLEPLQQRFLPVVNKSRPKPIAAALNKKVGRRVADDASASHHSSIFEAFEVAPLRLVSHVGESEDPAISQRGLLNELGVQHSYVRPGSDSNYVGFPEIPVERVIHDTLDTEDDRTRPHHSTDIVDVVSSERSRVNDSEVPQQYRNSEVLANREFKSDSFHHRRKTTAGGVGSLRNDKGRQGIRGGWKKIVMAGPALGTVRTFTSMASSRHSP